MKSTKTIIRIAHLTANKKEVKDVQRFVDACIEPEISVNEFRNLLNKTKKEEYDMCGEYPYAIMVERKDNLDICSEYPGKVNKFRSLLNKTKKEVYDICSEYPSKVNEFRSSLNKMNYDICSEYPSKVIELISNI